jgi:hypothetical protein
MALLAVGHSVVIRPKLDPVQHSKSFAKWLPAAAANHRV